MHRFFYFTFFLLTLHSVSFAQQWRPVLSGKTQYFIGPEVNGNDSIIWGFKTAFSHVQGLDSVFTFNRIVRFNEPFSPYWHICGGDSNWVTYDSIWDIHLNQANIAGETMVRMATGGQLFTLPSGDSLWLHPEFPVGQKWLYRNNTSDSAQIISRTFQNVLGIPDSVVEIGVSNGLTYRLSKNHGFQDWPFHLPIREENGTMAIEAGSLYRIEEDQLGRHIPSFQQFAELNPGDKLLILDIAGEHLTGHYRYDLHTVVSQTSLGDTIAYETLLDRTEYSNQLPTATSALTYIRDTLFSVLPGELYQDNSLPLWIVARYHQYYKKLSQYDGRIATYHPHIFLQDSCSTLAIANSFDVEYYYWLDVYLEGLGALQWIRSFNTTDNPFAYNFTRDLICYQKVGEPLHGDCDSSFQYIAVDDAAAPPVFNLYPNPASQTVTLDLGTETQEAFSITVYDLRGAILLQNTTQATSHSFPVDLYPAGLYLIEVRNSAGIRTTKKLNIYH